MSLFKTKKLWSNQCANEEEFDGYSLVVAELNAKFNFVIVGSHSGILRIYSIYIGDSGNAEYKPNDLLLEKELPASILQVGVGRLVS